jgi:hypothetical protein
MQPKGKEEIMYLAEHYIVFKDGSKTAPYRLTMAWKTVKGALKASERFALEVGKRYDNVSGHFITIRDEYGQFITNMVT